MRRELCRDAPGRRPVPLRFLDPRRVDSVARAVDVAAKQPLVGLDQVRLRAPHVAARGAREAPVSPERADMERIDDQRLDELQPRLRPRSRVQGDGDVALEQRLERSLGHPLHQTLGPVVLADDREAHQGPFDGRLAVARVPCAAPRLADPLRSSECGSASANPATIAKFATRDGIGARAGVRAYSSAASRPAAIIRRPDLAMRRFRYNRPRGPRLRPARSSRHAHRRRQCRREGADSRRGVAVHPALPRQDDHREVRRQRDGRARTSRPDSPATSSC